MTNTTEAALRDAAEQARNFTNRIAHGCWGNGYITEAKEIAHRLAAALSQPSPASSTDLLEAVAQFLHDEGGFADAWSGRTWPEHPDDDGQREGGFVKIVPSDAQAKFRDVARRLLLGFPSLSPSPGEPASSTTGET